MSVFFLNLFWQLPFARYLVVWNRWRAHSLKTFLFEGHTVSRPFNGQVRMWLTLNGYSFTLCSDFVLCFSLSYFYYVFRDHIFIMFFAIIFLLCFSLSYFYHVIRYHIFIMIFAIIFLTCFSLSYFHNVVENKIRLFLSLIILFYLQFCFAITYRRDHQRQYDLQAQSEIECKVWIEAIRPASFNKVGKSAGKYG